MSHGNVRRGALPRGYLLGWSTALKRHEDTTQVFDNQAFWAPIRNSSYTLFQHLSSCFSHFIIFLSSCPRWHSLISHPLLDSGSLCCEFFLISYKPSHLTMCCTVTLWCQTVTSPWMITCITSLEFSLSLPLALFLTLSNSLSHTCRERERERVYCIFCSTVAVWYMTWDWMCSFNHFLWR